MAQLYADENFDYPVVIELRTLGHDILTAREAGRAGQKIPDDQVLAYAITLDRAVLTYNRWHYVKLHSQVQPHKGIIVCTWDHDVAALTQRVHQAIANLSSLDNQLIRVNLPSVP